MKILLDEDLPHKLRMELGDHDAYTVAYVGWSGLKNGALLREAVASGFDVFLTGDQNLGYQQNLADRRLAIIVLTAQEWPVLATCLKEIQSAILHAVLGSFQTVLCGEST